MVLYGKIALDGNCCDCVPASEFSDICTARSSYEAYSCTGAGYDCGTNQTKQPDFDAFSPTTISDDCTNRTRQADYDANTSTGGGVGTFPINRTLTSTDPITGSFAFIGCDPNGLYVSQVTYEDGDGVVQVKNYTSPTNSFGTHTLHFWESTPSYRDSDLLDLNILSLTVSWKTDVGPGGAPQNTYQVKGSFTP